MKRKFKRPLKKSEEAELASLNKRYPLGVKDKMLVYTVQLVIDVFYEEMLSNTNNYISVFNNTSSYFTNAYNDSCFHLWTNQAFEDLLASCDRMFKYIFDLTYQPVEYINGIKCTRNYDYKGQGMAPFFLLGVEAQRTKIKGEKYLWKLTSVEKNISRKLFLLSAFCVYTRLIKYAEEINLNTSLRFSVYQIKKYEEQYEQHFFVNSHVYDTFTNPEQYLSYMNLKSDNRRDNNSTYNLSKHAICQDVL